MTEPLCDEPEAEQECENCLAVSIKVDPNNLDGLQGLANLRLLRNRDSEAIELLKVVHSNTMKIMKASAEEHSVGAVINSIKKT